MAPITNLYAKYKYKTLNGTSPVLVLMHGWNTDAWSFDYTTLARIANYGFFVVVPGMRGRDGADGANDASGREIYDIYDAVQYVIANFSVDSTRVAIVGYSGGGGSALAAACKFPDLFNVVVSHFGMSDYGYDNPDGWWYNNGGAYTAAIQTAVGGTPAAVPNNYRARNAVEAIKNYSGGLLHLFHDSGDTSVPIVHSQNVGAAMLAAGLSNYTEHYTAPGDDPRWTHGYPADTPDLIETEAIWYPLILSQAAWTVPASATHRIIGYIKTKRYLAWLRANGTTAWGVDAVADVQYGATPNVYTVTPLTGAIDATVTQADGKTGSATNFGVATDITVS